MGTLHWIARRHHITNTNRETVAFVVVLGICLAAFFHETLLGDKVLSPADVLLVSASFRDEATADYEPANRLLMDPVLQFQPWLEFNRRMVRSGHLPLWNSHAGCGVPHLANGQSAVFDPFNLIAYLGPMPRGYAWMAAGRLLVAGLGMFLLARSLGSRILGTLVRGPDLSVLRIPGRLAPVSRHARRDLDALAIPGHRSPVPGSRAEVGGRARRDHGPRSARGAYPDERPRPAGGRAVLRLETLVRTRMRDRDSADLARLGDRHWPGSGDGRDPDRAAGGLPLQEPGLGRPSTRETALVDRRRPRDTSTPSARRFPTHLGANDSATPTWRERWACTTSMNRPADSPGWRP